MASKRRQRRRQCDGKQKHATEGEAIAHAASLMRSGKTHKWLTPYRCKFCEWFHVG